MGNLMNRFVLFLLLLPISAVAQVGPVPGGGASGSSTITSGTTATSGCIAGGVLRSISNLVECGAGITWSGGTLTLNNGASAVSPLVVQDNGTPVLTVADGGITTFTQTPYVPDLGIRGASANTVLRWFNSGAFLQGASEIAFFTDNSGIMTGSTEGIGWTGSPGDASGGVMDTRFTREAAASVQMGVDVNGAAVNQTFKAHDGITGTDISGADLTIAAGRGTGAGTGGTVIFQTAPVGSTGTTAQTLATVLTLPKSGGLQVATGTKPTCEAATRGTLYYVAGGAGVADTYEVCKKDSGDAYAWASIF